MQPFNRHKKTPYGGYYRLLLQDANPVVSMLHSFNRTETRLFFADKGSLATFMETCKGLNF